MAKISFSLLLTLCGLVAFTLGQATVNPMNALGNPDLYSPEKQCPSVCASECALTKMTCIDIPNLVDCAALDASCSGQCENLCGCVSDCSTTCTASNPCADQTDSLAQITCYSQRLICTSTCQMNCPGTLAVQDLTSSIQAVMTQVSALMSPSVTQA